MRCGFYICSTSQFGQAIFQVYNSYMWLVVTTLNNAGRHIEQGVRVHGGKEDYFSLGHWKIDQKS